jgi:hypothetical protein
MVCYIQDEPGLHARPDTKSISATSMPKAFDSILNANAITIRRSIAAASNHMSSGDASRSPSHVLSCLVFRTTGNPQRLHGSVLIPGVSFALGSDGWMHPNPRHIKRLAAVTTYGRSRLDAWFIGDPQAQDPEALSALVHRPRGSRQLRSPLQPASQKHGTIPVSYTEFRG